MSERNFLLYLNDILESITAIESYLVGLSRHEAADDRKTWSATIRELEIIGEAAAKLPQEIKSAHPEVNWRVLKDFRNVLAHQYFGVNVDIVWDIVQNKLPVLKGQIAAIVVKIG